MKQLETMYKNCPEITGEITEENQLVVYTLVRESLNMSKGKVGGQCQHAIQYLMQKYSIDYKIEMKNKSNFQIRMCSWLNSDTHTKVVLGVSDKEWDKLKEEYDFIYVIDAGKTEIAEGSETVAILYPMLRSERSKVLKRCQLLKD